MLIFSFLSTLTDIEGKDVSEAKMKALDENTTLVLEALATDHEIYIVDSINYRIMDTILINSGLSHLNIVGSEQILIPLPDPGVIETLTMFDEGQKVTIIGSTQRDKEFALRAERPFVAVKSLTGEKLEGDIVSLEELLDIL
jgi:hypothetical protein